MNHFFKNLKTLIIFSVFFTFYFLFFIPANAQQTTPQFLVSWQSNSFAPSWFKGKVFPTTGSQIIVKFDLIDGGKIADLSKTAVRWYVNNNLILNEKNGLGIKTYSFFANDYVGAKTNVRISIPDYKGSVLDSVLDIPVVNPEVVINAPYFDKIISAGKLDLEAIPLFFNVNNLSSLSFSWAANGQPTTITGNPFLGLNIDAGIMSSGSGIDLSAMVKNIANELETASKNIKLIVK
jgi:hypothetical protein